MQTVLSQSSEGKKVVEKISVFESRDVRDVYKQCFSEQQQALEKAKNGGHSTN